MEISFAVRPLRSFYAYSPLRFPLSLSCNSLSSSSLVSSRALLFPLVAARSLSDDASTVDLATQPVEANGSPVKTDPIFEVQKKAIEVVNDPKGTSIFLVDMNSAMKAKIGKAIAEALRYGQYHQVASILAYDEFEQVTAEDMVLEVLTAIEKLISLPCISPW